MDHSISQSKYGTRNTNTDKWQSFTWIIWPDAHLRHNIVLYGSSGAVIESSEGSSHALSPLGMREDSDFMYHVC